MKALLSLSLLSASSFIASSWLVGCASSGGHDKAESTAMQMNELQVAIVSTKESLNAAAASLATVVEKAEEDPVPHFKQYEKDVKALEAGFKNAQSKTKALQGQGDEYFASWTKQAESLSDPDLKERALERRAKLAKAIEDVVETMKAASAELTTTLATIKDMQTYLSNDLTPDGIKSVKDKSKQVSKDARSIEEKLDEVVSALAKGEAAFKTAKPPPPPPPEKKS